MQWKNEDESREGKEKQDELKSYSQQRWKRGERAIRGCIDLNIGLKIFSLFEYTVSFGYLG